MATDPRFKSDNTIGTPIPIGRRASKSPATAASWPGTDRVRKSWVYDTPPEDTDYLLLSVQRAVTIGRWRGTYGEQFIAYSEIPVRDRIIEKRLISTGKIKAAPP